MNSNRTSLAMAAAKRDAVMASGAIIKVDSAIFLEIIAKVEIPLIVHSMEKAFFHEMHKYLTSYKGLLFYTESKNPILLPNEIELLKAERVWIPLT